MGGLVSSLSALLGKNRKELSEQLHLAQELIEVLPVPIFFKGRDGRYLGVNRAWEDFFGVPRETFIGKEVRDLYPQNPRVAQKHHTMDQELWERPGSQSYEIPVTARDGRLRHTLYYKATFTRADGQVAGLIGAIVDITERREAEKAWQESETRFRALTELSSDWYWEQDEALRFTAMSAGVFDSLGMRPEEFIGKGRWELPLIGVSEAELKAHQAVLEAHKPFQDFEFGLSYASGRTYYLSTSGQPVFEEDGRFKGYRGVGSDITGRKMAETALREAHDQLALKAQELARSNDELQQFAYVASHDLQEPLRMVSSYTQLLMRRYASKLDHDAKEFTDYIVDGAARMKQLIEDLLAYSRVGTGGREFKPADGEAVLYKALANLRAAIEASGAAITHDPLPSVTADESQLVQLLQNFIGNAIKFKGSEAPRIHVGAKEEGDAWVLSVADNGIGIDPQYFERIFVLFQRLHSKAEYPGTGIGLAICKKIIDRHGGRIWVESKPGHGCCFYFSLPKTQGEGDS